MSKDYISSQEDLVLEVLFRNASGEPIPIPSYKWRLVLSVVSERRLVVTHLGAQFVCMVEQQSGNCGSVVSSGGSVRMVSESKLLVHIDRQAIGCGQLQTNQEQFVPDHRFPDGSDHRSRLYITDTHILSAARYAQLRYKMELDKVGDRIHKDDRFIGDEHGRAVLTEDGKQVFVCTWENSNKKQLSNIFTAVELELVVGTEDNRFIATEDGRLIDANLIYQIQ